MDRLNDIAAAWWSDRFEITDKREELREALKLHLPDGDWVAYNDYDPQGPLLDAVREIVDCSGMGHSGDGLFPRKTGLMREGDELFAKEGYGRPGFILIATADPVQPQGL